MRRSRAASLCAALCMHVTAAGVVALAPGCAFLLKGNANTPVADGKLYEPGEDEYDAFFKELYDVQLLMGEAPDREIAARNKVAAALELPEGSTAEAVGDGVYERAAVLAKAGVMLKLSLTGTEESATPAATVVTVGEVKDEKDVKLVAALDEAVKADAELVAELRKARKPLERLRGKAAALEARVDTAFAKRTRAKKAEVRQNLADARQLVPLMADRGNEVQPKALHFLTTLQKVLGSPTSASGPTEVSEPPKKGAKPAKPKPAAKPVKPVPPPRAVPKPKPEAKEPAPPAAKKAPPEEPKKAPEEPKKKPPPKAPAEDFEP